MTEKCPNKRSVHEIRQNNARQKNKKNSRKKQCVTKDLKHFEQKK